MEFGKKEMHLKPADKTGGQKQEELKEETAEIEPGQGVRRSGRMVTPNVRNAKLSAWSGRVFL